MRNDKRLGGERIGEQTMGRGKHPQECSHFRSYQKEVAITAKAGAGPHADSKFAGMQTDSRRAPRRSLYSSVNSVTYGDVRAENFYTQNVSTQAFRAPAAKKKEHKFIATSTSSAAYQMSREQTLSVFTPPVTMPVSEMVIQSKPQVLDREYSRASNKIDFTWDAVRANGARTTADLQEGTTINANRLSGYTAHIPVSRKNQAIAAGLPVYDIPKVDCRDSYNSNMPGYTGFHSRQAKNDRGSFKCGTLTTTGASNAGGTGTLMPQW